MNQERDEKGRFTWRTKRRRLFVIRGRTAVEGLKLEMTISPSLFARLCRRDNMARPQTTVFRGEDNVYLEVNIYDVKTGEKFRWKPLEIMIRPGNEDLSPEYDQAPEYDDDGSLFHRLDREAPLRRPTGL